MADLTREQIVDLARDNAYLRDVPGAALEWLAREIAARMQPAEQQPVAWRYRYAHWPAEYDWRHSNTDLAEQRAEDADMIVEALYAQPPAMPAQPDERVVWLVLEAYGNLVHATHWREAAHEHINDAILNGYDDAARWIVRPAYLTPQPDERDERIAALERALQDCRLLAARHRREEWAQHILRFCGEVGVKGAPLRADAALAQDKGSTS